MSKETRHNLFSWTSENPSLFKTKLRAHPHPMRLPVLAYISIIALGSLILRLPQLNHQPLPWLDAIFTATSAVCVTGLSTVDIAQQFNTGGIAVIAMLMQIGGLGIMTISTTLMLMASSKAGFSQQALILGSFTQEDGMFSGTKILKEVLKFTAAIELVGFSVFWSQSAHPWHLDSALLALFHTISAFCNVGFALLSPTELGFDHSWLINLNFSMLFFAGSIGFVTLSELTSLFKHQRLSLHSRINLITTAILVAIALLAIVALERPHSIFPAFTQAFASRTAGFNALPTASFGLPILFIFSLLMFIGGSPGSCAGGIKTNTAAVIFLLGWNRIQGREHTQIMRSTVPPNTVLKALKITVFASFILALAIFAILLLESNRWESAPITDLFFKVCFEVISAFATCGASLGITPWLSKASQIILMVLMFVGRLGPLVLISAFSKAPKEQPWYAEEQIMVG